MTYSIIQPPFTLRFEEMTKKELREYAAWFHRITPERITQLEEIVKSTPTFESWTANRTPDSLEMLGRWFEGQVETRLKTASELEATRSNLKFPIELPTLQLTNRTFSLAMDLGMYFAQVMLDNVPGTRWDQVFGSKRYVDYGEPVLMGFGVVPMNPVGIMIVTARRVSKGKPAALRELYDVWAKMQG